MPSELPPDHLIASTYGTVYIPSDRLVSDPAKLAIFIAQLPPDYQRVDSAQLAHRLLTLRKKGRLPKTHQR